MELNSGIHKVDGVRGANCYLVPAADGLYLIDTGMPGNAQKIIHYLKEIGKNEKNLHMILLTHSDMDHSGSAAELKRRTGAKLAIHEGDAPSLSGEKELKKVKGVLGLLLRIMGKFMKFEKVAADVVLKDGEKVGPLTVIATPGHTEGSVSFFSEAIRTLFVGDALRTTKDGSPTMSPKIMTLDMDKAWESAETISKLTFDVMLPGHGEPVLQSAVDRVRQLVQKNSA
ncbi:MAG: MBL fold metallo-hydrolase [Spirochaetia bacterium]|jgi:glyoxylase-like metal-dependent hydrolase (beta-lactamase superfamily II)